MSRIKVKNTVIIILALSMLGMITGCDKKESDKTIESQTTKVESTTTETGSKEKVVKGTEEKKTTTKKDNKNGEEETKEENKNKTTETNSNKEDVKKIEHLFDILYLDSERRSYLELLLIEKK